MPDLRKPGLLGLPNVVAQPFCTVSTTGAAGLVPAGFEAAYLQTEEPSETARLSTVDPLHSRWEFAWPLALHTIGGVAIVNWNGSANALYRVVGFTTGNENALTTLTQAPNAIAASSNITGVVGNVDEAIYTPDASFITPTVTTSFWWARFSWAALSATPRAGASMAVFVVRVVLQGAPDKIYPTVEAHLYENGSPVASLGWRAVTVTSPGQVLIFPFNPSTLADPTGANLECRIEGRPGDNGCYAKLEAIVLYYENSGTALDLDSGWLLAPFSAYSDLDSPPPTKTAAYWPTTALVYAAGFHLLVMDDQVDHSPGDGLSGAASSLLQEPVPAGFTEAGVVVAGPAMFLERGIRHGSGPQTRVIVDGIAGVTAGGETYGADAFRRRAMTVELIVTRDEELTLRDRIAWRRGHQGAFFVAAEPDITQSRQTFSAFWATVENFGDSTPMPLRYDAGAGTLLYVVSVTLAEKL